MSATIINALASGNFRVVDHARERMDERGVSDSDIQSVGATAHSCTLQDNGRYRVVGTDLDGDRLTVICVYDGEAIVVTLF